MGIGVGIFLIALGAILTFAVNWTIGGLDLDTVGWILMIVGAGGLILFFYFWNRRRVPETVEAIRQPQMRSRPPTYDDTAPPQPATVTAAAPVAPPPATMATVAATAPVAPPPATMATVAATAPVAPPPETVGTVTATAAVPAASQGQPDRR
jgi:hypothetical protein